MKKLLIPVLSLFVLTAAAQPNKTQKKKTIQPKGYFRAGLGYALSHGGAVQAPVPGYSSRLLLPVNGSNIVNSTSGSYSETFDLSRGSYTAGVHGALTFGLMVTKHIGVEVAANVGLSTKTLKTSLTANDPQDRVVFNASQQAMRPVMITPSIVLETGGQINLYTRGGLVIPVLSKIEQVADYTQDRYNEQTQTFIRYRSIQWTEEFKMRISPGFSGAVGVKYKAGKRISVWGELGILSMSLYYKTSELTSFELTDLTGRASLEDLTPAQRTTQFEFTGTLTNNSNTVPTSQVPFSNFNFAAGIALDL